MELLGIGFFELMLIFIIALIVLGPEEMVRVGAAVGKFIRNMRRSEVWRGFQRMSRAVRTFPDDLARQAGIDELRREIQSNDPRKIGRPGEGQSSPSDLTAWTQVPERLESNLSLPPVDPSDAEETDQTEPGA
ncbi:MAG: twin-arginine translocase TatA/TatE family subunit [Anaerolineae bacterium]|nr:twin-arginine translocase TatA/TatE family subunit [Anaerolineae bacterium]